MGAPLLPSAGGRGGGAGPGASPQESPQARPSVGLSLEDSWAEYQERRAMSATSSPEESADTVEGDEDSFGSKLRDTTARGVARAANEASNTVLGIGKAFWGQAFNLFDGGDVEAEWREWAEQDTAEANPFQFDIKERPGGWWGFYEGAVQFVTGFATASKALKGSQLAVRGGRTVTAAAAGAIADFAAFDPFEERLSNLVQQGPEFIQNPVSDFLAADEDDSEIEGRVKNALEGLMIGTAIDTFMVGLKYLKTKRAHRAGRLTDEEALEQASAHLKEAAEIDEVRLQEEMPAYRVEVDNAAGEAGDETVWRVVRQREDVVDTLGPDAPGTMEFKTPGEAQRVAGSLDLVDRLNSKPAGDIALTTAETSKIRAVAARALSTGVTGKDLDELLQNSNFNMSFVDSSDEAKSVLGAISDVIGETFDANSGRFSDKELVGLADDIVQGVSGQEFIQNLKEIRGVTRVLPQHVLAARIMLHGGAKRVWQFSKALDLDPRNPIARRAMEKELDGLAELAVTFTGVNSDIGRALVANQPRVTDDALAALRGGADTQLDLGVGRGTRKVGISDGMRRANLSAREISAMARTLVMTQGDSRAMLRAMRLYSNAVSPGAEKGAWDKIVSFRASMMLSGLKTHFVNFTSSFLAAHQVPFEVMIGGAISGNRPMARQGLDMLTSPYADGFFILREAASGMKRAWKENRSILDPTFVKDERGVATAFSDPQANLWLKILGAPGRALVSGDEFIKRMSYMSHVRSQSLRNARKDAEELGVEFTPEEMLARVYSDMENSVDEGGEWLWGNAVQHARNVTFTDKLRRGTGGHALQELAESVPGFRLIMPFIRTPVNLFNFAHQRTPLLNAFNRQHREMLQQGGEQAAQAQAQTALGSFAYGMAAFMAFNETISGKGPDNPALRAQLLESGWQPYSVRIGDKWISYRRIEPISTPIAIAADMVSTIGEIEDHKTAEEISMGVLAAFSASVTSKSFMMGLVDFFEAAGSGTEANWTQFARSQATSFVTPALVRQANSDKVWREVDTFLEHYRSTVPGLSQGLEPRRNLFGEPVMRTARQAFGGGAAGYTNQAFNPFTVVDGRDIDDIQLELAELGRAMPMPRDTRANGKIRLRDRDWENTDRNRLGQSPYDRWMELVQKPGNGRTTLRTRLTDIMRSERWGTWSNERKVLEASRMVQSFQSRAYNQMLREYPDLRNAMRNERISEVEALFKNPSN